ncbi:uncharacterized protein LOC109829595 [Asparagus officinalis]|uniref:uncharacterized protein LOC109829595 n=1 Tax=Asparagus officinalis TaxID=4686 RepID=UPI00098E4999|nr:uncharacterized protein LOC109829595 [Asparagus officinalis]
MDAKNFYQKQSSGWEPWGVNMLKDNSVEQFLEKLLMDGIEENVVNMERSEEDFSKNEDLVVNIPLFSEVREESAVEEEANISEKCDEDFSKNEELVVHIPMFSEVREEPIVEEDSNISDESKGKAIIINEDFTSDKGLSFPNNTEEEMVKEDDILMIQPLKSLPPEDPICNKKVSFVRRCARFAALEPMSALDRATSRMEQIDNNLTPGIGTGGSGESSSSSSMGSSFVPILFENCSNHQLQKYASKCAIFLEPQENFDPIKKALGLWLEILMLLPILLKEKDTVKDDIMKLFEEFYEGTLEINRLNYAHIVLIPKKEDSSVINDYRPVSLLNVIYKVITKVLTNRLNTKLDLLIDPLQSGFIKNRYLLDGVAAAQEIINDCFQNKKRGGILLKLDFVKAYDMLDWDFIFDVLKAKKFGDKWIHWMRICLHGGMSVIDVNGKVGKWIMSKRGVRQGDPLSPLLFVLAADSFTKMLNLAVESHFIEGLGPNNMRDKVHCLQYADDTLIFCKNNREQLTVLKLILYCFELASGLQISFNKSVLIALENDESLQQGLATMMNCKSGSFPITYIGMPLRPGKLKKDDRSPLISKIEKRLALWKGNSLSRGGRLVLVNDVLSSIPTFWLSYFLFPVWVIEKIDKMRRRFLWSGSLEHKGCSNLVKWDEVCKPKKCGGLGVKNLKVMNKALLGKWLWKCTRVEIGNGNYALFWLDKWLGSFTLASLFPSLFSFTTSPYACVSSLRKFENDSWRWEIHFKRQLTGSLVLQYLSMMNLINSKNFVYHDDKREWIWETKKMFTVKSYYIFLNDGGVRYDCMNLWGLPVPLKVKVLVWLALRESLNTKDMLNRKGIQVEKTCCLCSAKDEDHAHLFLNCSKGISARAARLQERRRKKTTGRLISDDAGTGGMAEFQQQTEGSIIQKDITNVDQLDDREITNVYEGGKDGFRL